MIAKAECLLSTNHYSRPRNSQQAIEGRERERTKNSTSSRLIFWRANPEIKGRQQLSLLLFSWRAKIEPKFFTQRQKRRREKWRQPSLRIREGKLFELLPAGEFLRGKASRQKNERDLTPFSVPLSCSWYLPSGDDFCSQMCPDVSGK